MEINYTLLNWDTEQFGYKIVSVRPDKMSYKDLEELVHNLSNNGVKLIYFFADPTDGISNQSLERISAFLADEKITFHNYLKQNKGFYSFSSSIIPYKLECTSEKLRFLALQSGIYSRFKLDTKFVNHEYEKLYNVWIDKSVKKNIADEILVYYKDDDEKGFITIETKKTIGSIGLIAVDEKERGNSIGKELMNAAFSKFTEKGISNVEVVTQKANVIACKFYETLGFEIKNIENVYHLWIN